MHENHRLFNNLGGEIAGRAPAVMRASAVGRRCRGPADGQVCGHDGAAAVSAAGQRVELGQEHGNGHAPGLLNGRAQGGQGRVAEVGAENVVAAHDGGGREATHWSPERRARGFPVPGVLASWGRYSGASGGVTGGLLAGGQHVSEGCLQHPVDQGSGESADRAAPWDVPVIEGRQRSVVHGGK